MVEFPVLRLQEPTPEATPELEVVAASSESDASLVQQAVDVIFPPGKSSRRVYSVEQVTKLFDLVLIKKKSVVEASKLTEIKSGTCNSYLRDARAAIGLNKTVPVSSKDNEIIPLPVAAIAASLITARAKETVPRANQKLFTEHSQYLTAFFEFNHQATLQDACNMIMDEFGVNISPSGIHKHMRSKCCLTIKTLKKAISLKSIKVSNIPYLDEDYIYVDCVDMLMFVRHSFGWKVGKQELKEGGDVPAFTAQSGILVPTLAAFLENELVSVSVVSPSAVVQNEGVKAENCKMEYYKDFFEQTMQTHLKLALKGNTFLVTDASVYHCRDIRKLLKSKGYYMKLSESFYFEHLWWCYTTRINQSQFEKIRWGNKRVPCQGFEGMHE